MPLPERTLLLLREQWKTHRHPDLFALIPPRLWRQSWNVGCQAAGSGEKALRYLARYVFKTATGNRLLSQLPDGRLRWPYRDSRTGAPAAKVRLNRVRALLHQKPFLTPAEKDTWQPPPQPQQQPLAVSMQLKKSHRLGIDWW